VGLQKERDLSHHAPPEKPMCGNVTAFISG